MPVVHLGCMHQQLFVPPADVADGSKPVFAALKCDFRITPVCGRLQVGKDFFHVAGLVGAAVCSAFRRG
jgi:hypothetical protein